MASAESRLVGVEQLMFLNIVSNLLCDNSFQDLAEIWKLGYWSIVGDVTGISRLETRIDNCMFP